MRKPSDFDARITSIADPDDTSDADIQAMEPAARVALTLAQRDLGRQTSDRQIVRGLLPNLLCGLEAGYDTRDIHEALIELKVFKGALATFRRTIAAERKQHPRLSATVQDRLWTDFHEGEPPAQRRHLH